VLTLTLTQRDAVVATCIRALPDEGCGLLLGTREGVVRDVMASDNVAHSARLYEIDSRVMLRASRRAEQEGLEVIGVFHSHTHTEAYPSATDVTLAGDPSWHYVLVSLAELPTVVRSFHIVEAHAVEEEVMLAP
jgi:proteasome lid subunit RPN8/RPN11